MSSKVLICAKFSWHSGKISRTRISCIERWFGTISRRSGMNICQALRPRSRYSTTSHPNLVNYLMHLINRACWESFRWPQTCGLTWTYLHSWPLLCIGLRWSWKIPQMDPNMNSGCRLSWLAFIESLAIMMVNILLKPSCTSLTASPSRTRLVCFFTCYKTILSDILARLVGLHWTMHPIMTHLWLLLSVNLMLEEYLSTAWKAV